MIIFLIQGRFLRASKLDYSGTTGVGDKLDGKCQFTTAKKLKSNEV